MLIPTPSSNFDLCPSKLLSARSFTSDVVSTAKSFEHWDTCMDNKTCKIVAIVGICLAALMLLWIVSGILRCLCCSVTGICEALCCCFLCCRGSRGRTREIDDDAPSGQNPFNPQKEQPLQQMNYSQYSPPPQQFHYAPGTVSNNDTSYAPGGAAEKYYDPYANNRRQGNY